MLTTQEFYGVTGNRTHLTRLDEGLIDPTLIAHILGENGEIRGHHRNMRGAVWADFLGDCKKNGVIYPILIIVDPGKTPVVREGNHRLDAALELKIKIPVQIKYFGNSQKETTFSIVKR